MYNHNINTKKYKYIIGVDEVGRGPLAGPVCVCAVAMRNQSKGIPWKIEGTSLTDSKKMTKFGRELWFKKLKQMQKDKEIFVAISFKSAIDIDKKGISFCIKDCISKNLKSITRQIKIKNNECQILLDGGLRAPIEYRNQKTIIKGDLKKKIISMASVYAKVTRDVLMDKEGKKFPNYDWQNNKGYGTKKHIEAIKKHGIAVLHRKSFLKNILIDKNNK